MWLDKELIDLYRHGGVSSGRNYNFSRQLGIQLHTWDRIFLCRFLGIHTASHYCERYKPVVHWICDRCQSYRHWGLYKDGPRGPKQPTPTEYEIELCRRADQQEEVEQEERRYELNSKDVLGECNARWEGNKCKRREGHEGPHGLEVSPGLVLAPWSD